MTPYIINKQEGNLAFLAYMYKHTESAVKNVDIYKHNIYKLHTNAN